MSFPLAPVAIMVCVSGIGLYLLMSSFCRGPTEVLIDLESQRDLAPQVDKMEANNCASNAKFGLQAITQTHLKRTAKVRRLFPIFTAIFLICAGLLFGLSAFGSSIALASSGLGLGYLLAKRWERQQAAKLVRRIEYFLPIVMERIVLAVQAGFDVLASIKAIIDYCDVCQLSTKSAALDSTDPVTTLFRQVYGLVENGRSLDESLNAIAAAVPCPALRHAFVHLALAHNEGGELIMPLRELSESTQLYYQESVEEDIAKMPVRATLPLLCTFTGLIIFFLTAPIMQVMEITTKAMPQ